MVAEGDRSDVFAIPVTDPRYRMIEIDMDCVTRSRLRVVLSDVNRGHLEEFPRRIYLPLPRNLEMLTFTRCGTVRRIVSIA